MIRERGHAGARRPVGPRDRGPAPGECCSEAKLAWPLARAGLIAFTDDDCRPAKGWAAASGLVTNPRSLPAFPAFAKSSPGGLLSPQPWSTAPGAGGSPHAQPVPRRPRSDPYIEWHLKQNRRSPLSVARATTHLLCGSSSMPSRSSWWRGEDSGGGWSPSEQSMAGAFSALQWATVRRDTLCASGISAHPRP